MSFWSRVGRLFDLLEDILDLALRWIVVLIIIGWLTWSFFHPTIFTDFPQRQIQKEWVHGNE